MFSHQGPDYRRIFLRAAICSGLICSVSVLTLCSSRKLPGKVALAATSDLHLDHPDAVCRNCHQQIYDRYEQTPMAQGSGLAVSGLDKAQLDAKDLTHRPSGVTYHVSLKGNQAYLSYARPATDPRGPLDGEHRLDFFIGSGHRGRTYLYQQDGLWFEAPINWYSKAQQWDMAPAYDQARTMPGPMPVDPNCLHCHAGNVQQMSGAAHNRFATQPFLSGGVGCSSCHGDPTAHLASTRNQASLRGPASPRAHAASLTYLSSTAIINPSKLMPAQRDSICLQCHLEGDATVYFPGKSLQTYRPGEDLSDSVAYFVDKSKANLGLRASSQYEALLRSACKRGAGDRLTCTTCHDPHGSPAPDERVAFFRSKCLSCHSGKSMATRHHPEQQDCASCHMPSRKTADISHEQLTDHDIEAKPSSTLQLSSISGDRHSIDLEPVGANHTHSREIGLAYAQMVERGDRNSLPKAMSMLQRAENEGDADIEVLDRLAFLLQISGSIEAAANRYRAALLLNPKDLTAAADLAVIDAGRGQTDDAISLLKSVVEADPSQTTVGLNLAFLECREGKKVDGRNVVQTMLHYNPDSSAARRFIDTGFYGQQHCDLRAP